MSRYRKYLISAVILFLGFSISFGMYFSLSKANEQKRKDIQSGIYEAIEMSIQREIDINLNALYAIRADYLANDGFNESQFRKFTEHYISSIGSIQALEWVPQVTLAQRDSFELAIKAGGYPDFEIFTMVEGTRLRAEPRPVYYPVAYVSPVEGNEAALGFAPGDSNMARSSTISSAISSGKASISEVINIIQKTAPNKAVLVFVPVFANDSSLIGLVEGVYLIEELINAGIAGLDFSEAVKISLIADNNRLVYGDGPDLYFNCLTGELSFADRNYQLHVEFRKDIGSDIFDIRLLLLASIIITVFMAGIVFYAINNTERQHKTSRANIESIFKVSENPIAIFDKNLRLKEWNEALSNLNYQLKGYKAYLGMKMPDELNVEGERLKSKIMLGEHIKSTRSLKLKNGDSHFIFNYLPIKERGTITGFCSLIQDVTALKKYEVALETYSLKLEDLVDQRTIELDHSNKELIQRNQELSDALNDLKLAQEELVQSRKMASLGVISAGVGHEINNPLNFIIGGVTILEQTFTGQMNEEQKNAIKTIKIGAKRASDIVKTIGRFSRKSDSHEEYCDIHAILDGCILLMSNSIKAGVLIEKEYNNDPLVVLGNEGMFHQAFLNILMNAEQAIETRGEIRVKTSKKGNLVIIEISDSGEGISPENLHKILDPFFSTKEPGKGVGLGLFMTYNILTELNGKIEYSSKIGVGTTCTVTLKLTDLA